MYDKHDIIETILGCFSNLLFFTALNTTKEFSINPIIGLILTIFWIVIVYESAIKVFREKSSVYIAIHLFIDYAIVFILSIFFMYLFGNKFNLFSFNTWFGSIATVATWIGFPFAFSFDMYDIRSLYASKKYRLK